MSRKLALVAASILGLGMLSSAAADTGFLPGSSVVTSKNNEPDLISLYVTGSYTNEVLNGFEKENDNFLKAKAGDAQAAKSLITMADSIKSSYLLYLKGLVLINGYGGIPKDEAAGSLLVRQAAFDGIAPAQESMVDYHLLNNNSSGVKFWCSKLSYYNDSARCQYILGWMYENDQGISQNQRIAFNFYRLAANQNYPEAVYKVGEYYFWGQGSQMRNPALAQEYLVKAIRLNSDNARVLYGFYKSLYPNTREEQREGVRYLNEGIKQGNANALYFASYISFKQHNQEAGFKYLRAAAAQQQVRANTLLGDLYFTGGSQDFPDVKVDIDYRKALDYYENAAFFGNSNIQLHIGYVYFKGFPGVPADYKKALNWLNRAAKNGNGFAYGLLATMYHEGIGVAVDDDKASAYIEQACNLGYQRACTIKLSQVKLSTVLPLVEKEVNTYTPASTLINPDNEKKPSDKQ